jgi:hypothetical protein
MSIEAFRENPWKESHPTYEKNTFFHIRPAPEFATAEVVFSSLYRICGFDIPERDVPSSGREFSKNSQSTRVHERSGSQIDMETWRTVLNGVLESPKQPNQSSKRFLQMCPIVPDIALYSGSPRLTGNSWPSGQLIQRMIGFGSEDHAHALVLWQNLFEALSVTEHDDIWARWLHQEFCLRRKSELQWKLSTLPHEEGLPNEEKRKINYPARQFARDLSSIIESKPFMTRRQWVSLFESVIRIGCVTHVLWLCDLNYKVWQAIRRAINSGEQLSPDQVTSEIITTKGHYLTYGNPGMQIIKDYASRYLVARVGINLVLWELQARGINITSIRSCAELSRFLGKVSQKRGELKTAGVEAQVTELQEGEKNARTIACKKGIGSNIVEFARHVLGQRQTANETLRGYDQGYIFRKKAEYSSAPWVVGMGPVSILALVHCCLRDAAGPRSIQKLCQHLESYGIRVDRANVTTGDLGKNLRMLGLVLDSPDAENGMLLVPPFDVTTRSPIS